MQALLLPLLFGLSDDRPLEAGLEPFLGEPDFSTTQAFAGERFPNVLVSLEGTVVVLFGSSQVRARRSTDGGASFGEEIPIADGIHGGGAIVDEGTGDLLAFVEAQHPPAALSLLRSTDDGRSWVAQEFELRPDALGRTPSMHMNEAGITLRHGAHAGRLLRASRWYAGQNDRSKWPEHLTNAIWSDDGGRSWHTSEPFPENGTGEAALAELSDGRIYYNSRVHWQERPRNTRRRAAFSADGGQSWEDYRIVDVLPDGHQHRSYGCMGGLVRLPVAGRDILIFSNIDTQRATRERGTVWASFDGGQSWPVKRLVHDGPSAYSSLSVGRPQTPSEGWIYLHHEGGAQGASQLARFDLAWILEGEHTGDGELPAWLPAPANARAEEEEGEGQSARLR